MHLDHHFALDPSVTFLNHGSFGAAPRAVLAAQQRLRDRMEAQPVQFLVRDLEGLLDEARAAVGAFVDAPADDLVFVPNATHAVNAVLRSLTLSPGDELVVTDTIPLTPEAQALPRVRCNCPYISASVVSGLISNMA